MRIALWNASGLRNLGDQLIDEVTRRELARRLDDVAFETFSPWPRAGIAPLAIDASGRWNGHGAFDAIVIGGGAILTGPPFLAEWQQNFFLGPFPERFADDVPVIWNAVCSDGQFVAAFTEPWRDYVRRAVRRLSAVSVRNERTAEFLRSCGVDGTVADVAVVPDPVVMLEQPAQRPRGELRRSNVPLIGIAIGTRGHARNVDAMLRPTSGEYKTDRNPAVCIVDDAGVATSVFTGAGDLDGEVANRIATAFEGERAVFSVCAFGDVYGDASVAESIAGALSAGRVHCFGDGRAALHWITSLDCLIASRYHACMLAIVAGTPCVMVDPNFSPVPGTSKLRELARSAGLEAFYMTLDEFLREPERLNDVMRASRDSSSAFVVARDAMLGAASAHFDSLAALLRDACPAAA